MVDSEVGKGAEVRIMQYSKGSGELLVVLSSRDCFRQEWNWAEEVRGYRSQGQSENSTWTRKAVGMEMRGWV